MQDMSLTSLHHGCQQSENRKCENIILNLARAHKTGCTHASLHGKYFRHRSCLERLHRLQGLTYKPLLDTSNCILRMPPEEDQTHFAGLQPTHISAHAAGSFSIK